MAFGRPPSRSTQLDGSRLIPRPFDRIFRLSTMSNPERKKIAWDETWNAAYGWYSELASGSVNSMKMKNLVEKLMSAPDLAGLFAHTTAASLVISPYSIYPDWAEGRRISLQARGENVVRVQLNALRESRHPLKLQLHL